MSDQAGRQAPPRPPHAPLVILLPHHTRQAGRPHQGPRTHLWSSSSLLASSSFLPSRSSIRPGRFTSGQWSGMLPWVGGGGARGGSRGGAKSCRVNVQAHDGHMLHTQLLITLGALCEENF